MSLKSENLSSDYTITHAETKHQEYDGDLPDNSEAVPFRFMSFGPFNIRNQSAQKHYKTFVGEQKS